MEKKIIIVGSGISGITLANVLANAGWDVTIYEKENHIGGNCYDSYDQNGILIHNYGPHIFHTSYEDVYRFVSTFTKLNTFINKVIVNVEGKQFPLPINFKSIDVIMGDKANNVKETLKAKFPNQKTITLFDLRQIDDANIKEFLDWISKNVYFNYSAKMWGVKFEDIDPNTISRVKIVLGDEHNYFPDDKYQGLPVDGFTTMMEKMLDHKNIHLYLNVNAIDHIKFGDSITWDNQVITCPVIYCGPLDEVLNYQYGILPYRSLNIEFESINKTYYQNTAVVNYPADPTMTRIAEYKWLTSQNKDNITTISKEYPGQFDFQSNKFNKRFYPIVNEANKQTYNKYVQFFKKYSNFYALGRLSQYKYIDMDDAIKLALDLAKELNHE